MLIIKKIVADKTYARSVLRGRIARSCSVSSVFPPA